MEGRALYNELVPRLRSIELTGEPSYMQTTFVGGPKHLPVLYDPRQDVRPPDDHSAALAARMRVGSEDACRERPLPALISSRVSGVHDVAGEGFELRRGRAISSASTGHSSATSSFLAAFRACRRPSLMRRGHVQDTDVLVTGVVLARAGENRTLRTRLHG